MKTITTNTLGQIIRGLILCNSIIVCSSCATSDLADSWKSENFDTLSNDKILVVSESSKIDDRKSYEIAIANKLRNRNINAVESHIQFPSLKWTKTPDKKVNRTQLFKDADIPGIILTSIKQTIETHNGTIAKPMVSLEGDIDKKISVSNSNNLKESSNTSKIYVLEALMYNLALEEDEQLVSVFLVDITDPNSSDTLRRTLTKIVANQFK